MTNSEIENLKGALRARLRRDFVEVSSARDTSRKAHLEVFESKRGGRAIGVEFDHVDRVNLWVVRLGCRVIFLQRSNRWRRSPMAAVAGLMQTVMVPTVIYLDTSSSRPNPSSGSR